MTKEERAAEYRKKHFGECAVANCGMKMFIIAYRNNDDIDIVFQNGTIVKNKRYKNFTKGKIANPNKEDFVPHKKSSLWVNRVGETAIATNHQKMIIVKYISTRNIDVCFDDGTIVKNKKYKYFKCGSIQNPSCLPSALKIGETNIAVNGQTMTIIAYKDNQNIDVKFEDGTVVRNKSYQSFRCGKIANPNVRMKFQDRTGESGINIDGQKMTIVKYLSCDDIDVQFEDGTVLKNKKYRNFKQGLLHNPNTDRINKNLILDRIGEIATNHDNEKMQIVEYKSHADIAVQFEDGTIVTGQTYYNFKMGKIKSTYQKKPIVLPSDRIGKTHRANNGQMMTIIAYRGAYDIDIQFDDGVIVTNKSYGCFVNGKIANPKRPATISTSINEYAILFLLKKYGFVKAERNSLKKIGLGRMEIDCYHPTLKIAIEYDGEVWHKSPTGIERDLRKNKRCQAAGIKIIRIREPNCPFINDNISNDFYLNNPKQLSDNFINVLFDVFKLINNVTNLNINISKEYILKHIDEIYQEYGKDCYVNRLGETNVATNGQTMTIVTYRHSNNIDVQFEDGTIVPHKTYKAFKIGGIFNPNCPKVFNQQIREQRVGETATTKNGQKMTIVAYRNVTDIDVQFEDGTIVYHKTYAAFKKRKLSNPNYTYHDAFVASKLNEIGCSRDGQKIIITAYRSCSDIDVCFEDGTKLQHKAYQDFKNGDLFHPNFNPRSREKYKRIGELNLMKDGQTAIIVDYRNANDVDIQFENGQIYEHVKYYTFKNGGIPSSKKLKTMS